MPNRSSIQVDDPFPVPDSVVAACTPVLSRLRESAAEPIAVTSASRGEGRTTVAAALATAAQLHDDAPTVLLDLDPVRSPWRGRPGLSEVLTGDLPLMDAVAWLGSGLLPVLPAGNPGDDDTDRFLQRFADSSVMADLHSNGLTLVADLPPLHRRGKTHELASRFGSVLLVVQAGVTPRSAVREAAKMLAEPPVVLLNRLSSVRSASAGSH